MSDNKYGSGSEFLDSLDLNKTFSSVKQESTLRFSDLFKVFYTPSTESKKSPKV